MQLTIMKIYLKKKKIIIIYLYYLTLINQMYESLYKTCYNNILSLYD